MIHYFLDLYLEMSSHIIYMISHPLARSILSSYIRCLKNHPSIECTGDSISITTNKGVLPLVISRGRPDTSVKDAYCIYVCDTHNIWELHSDMKYLSSLSCKVYIVSLTRNICENLQLGNFFIESLNEMICDRCTNLLTTIARDSISSDVVLGEVETVSDNIREMLSLMSGNEKDTILSLISRLVEDRRT